MLVTVLVGGVPVTVAVEVAVEVGVWSPVSGRWAWSGLWCARAAGGPAKVEKATRAKKASSVRAMDRGDGGVGRERRVCDSMGGFLRYVVYVMARRAVTRCGLL